MFGVNRPLKNGRQTQYPGKNNRFLKGQCHATTFVKADRGMISAVSFS
jgi:hypothetical protein